MIDVDKPGRGGHRAPFREKTGSGLAIAYSVRRVSVV